MFVFASAATLCAQSAPSPDVMTIAKMATKASVVIVASDPSGKPLSQGSGFVVSKDGRIVTNLHVIRGAASAVVKFADGAFYEVEGFLGEDLSSDIAVLKLRTSGKEFPFLRLADVDQVSVGQHVIAIPPARGAGDQLGALLSNRRGSIAASTTYGIHASPN
jgi:S1-C subfamily serine protease